MLAVGEDVEPGALLVVDGELAVVVEQFLPVGRAEPAGLLPVGDHVPPARPGPAAGGGDRQRVRVPIIAHCLLPFPCSSADRGRWYTGCTQRSTQRSRGHARSASAVISSGWMCPLLATTSTRSALSCGRPSNSVSRPPACSRISCPAAMSHGVHRVLAVRLQPPGRDRAQRQRGRPEGPDPAGHRHQPLDQPRVGADLARVDRLRLRDDERPVKTGDGGDPQRRAVQRRAAPGPGREQLVVQRIVDRPGHRPAVRPQRHRHAEERQPVRVVGGAVERVDVPDVTGAGVPAVPSSPFTRWCGNVARIIAVTARCASRSAAVTRFARASL